MKKFNLKPIAATLFGATLITNSVLPGAISVDAASGKVKKVTKGVRVTKSGKLISSKTGKAVKGIISYKGKVYKDGKTASGVVGGVYYKSGKKATGLSKGVYYKNGVKGTGTYIGILYVKGKKAEGLVKGVYYNTGKKVTGEYKEIYYVNGKIANGEINGVYYENGKAVTDDNLQALLYKVKSELTLAQTSLNEAQHQQADLAAIEARLGTKVTTLSLRKLNSEDVAVFIAKYKNVVSFTDEEKAAVQSALNGHKATVAANLQSATEKVVQLATKVAEASAKIAQISKDEQTIAAVKAALDEVKRDIETIKAIPGVTVDLSIFDNAVKKAETAFEKNPVKPTIPTEPTIPEDPAKPTDPTHIVPPSTSDGGGGYIPPTIKVSSINAIEDKASVGKDYVLPLTVKATMSDGSKKDIAVTWTSNDQHVKIKDGKAIFTAVATYVLNGSVTGYKDKVNLTVTVPQTAVVVTNATQEQIGENLFDQDALSDVKIDVSVDNKSMIVTAPTGHEVTKYEKFWGSDLDDLVDKGIYFAVNITPKDATLKKAKIITFDQDGNKKTAETFNGVLIQLVKPGVTSRDIEIAWDGENFETYHLDFSNVKLSPYDVALNEKIGTVTTVLKETKVGTEVGQVGKEDQEALALALTTAEGVYAGRTKKVQVEIVAAITELDDALTKFNGKVIKPGDATNLNGKISEATTIFNRTTVGTGVGQASQGDKDTLAAALKTVEDIYNDRDHNTQAQIDAATTALDDALKKFNGKVIKPGDASAFTLKFNETNTLYTNAVEGTALGQYIVGSKVTLKDAIDAAQLVLTNASSKTDQQLADAMATLNQAVNTFENSKVVGLTGLENVTITGTGTDSSNQITLNNGESLVLSSSDKSGTVATVIESPTGTIKITGVAVGGPVTITVQVKKDGQVIKTGTFEVTNEAPASITSKTMTKLDFSTVNATQAKLVSKPVTVQDFTGNRKDFTIVVLGESIPIYINWALSTDFPIGAAMGSVVESHIQDYFYQKYGINGFALRTVTAFGFGNEFQISTFQTGSTASFSLEGKDWSYFFDQSTTKGTDMDTSKNRSFTVNDGTRIVTIQLTSSFATIDALVNHINNYLTNANVKAKAEKISETQFKITSTSATGKLIIDGANKADFFE